MREYKDPTVEVIELPEEDVITTSNVRYESDTNMPEGQIPLSASYRGGNSANGQ